MAATNTFRSTYKGNPRLTEAGVLLRNGDFPNKVVRQGIANKSFKYDSGTRSQITYIGTTGNPH
jgi:hypothetical protein